MAERPGLRRLWRRDPPEELYLDEDDLRALERAKLGVALLGGLAVVGVLVSYGSLGFAGLLLSLSALAVVALLVLALATPAAPPRRRGGRRPRRTQRSPLDEPYPSYQLVTQALSWSQVSPRHYDLVTRPLLVRVLASRLAERHGVDLHRSPDQARRIVGEQLWWWLDPSRAAAGSSQPPGVPVATLDRLVQRLEQL